MFHWIFNHFCNRRVLWPVFVVLTVGLGWGCAREPAQAPPVDSSPARGERASPPSALVQQIKAARRQLRLDDKAMETTALNDGSAAEVLDKLERTFGGLGVRERIPNAPQLESLRSELDVYSKRVGFKASTFEFTPTSSAKRQIPDTLVGKQQIEYKPEQIVGTVKISIALEPIDLGLLQRWIDELAGSLERMVWVRGIEAKAGAFHVLAEAYWFLPLKSPRHKPTLLPLTGYLTRAGVEVSVDALRKGPERELLEDIERRYGVMAARQDAAERTLTLLAKGHYVDAQWLFFRTRSAQIEKIELTDVYQ